MLSELPRIAVSFAEFSRRRCETIRISVGYRGHGEMQRCGAIAAPREPRSGATIRRYGITLGISFAVLLPDQDVG
jgi:hypothetical protein